MRKTLIYSFCFVILIIILSYCDETPTTPELPKKKAELKISLEQEPVVLYYSSNTECWYHSGWLKVIISETNGVGCSVSTVKLELMYQGDPTWPKTEEGGKIIAFGSFYVLFSDVYTCTTAYDRIKVTAEGGDDNDFKISTSAYFNILYVGGTE